MVQDSVVDQRSEDGNNKLRGAVVVEIAISYPDPWVHMAIFRTCVDNLLAPIYVDGQVTSSLQV